MIPFTPFFDPPTPPRGGYLKSFFTVVLCDSLYFSVKVLELFFASFVPFSTTEALAKVVFVFFAVKKIT
jgi:hypothetical protein